VPNFAARGRINHGARYFAGAALSAVVSNLVLIGGDHAKLPDLISVVLSWFAGGTIGYAWHHKISFGTEPSLGGYLRFMGGSALGIPLAYGAIAFFHTGLRWQMWLAAPSATIVLFGYNYASARIAILKFRR